MNAIAASTGRKTGMVSAGRGNGTQHRHGGAGDRSDRRRLNSRARRKLIRQNGLRSTVIGTCGIMPLTESEAREHRQLVKTQFFADLAEWERTPPTVAHFLLQGWKFPVVILGAALLAGFLFGAMLGWIGLAVVFGFGGSLREAINEATITRRIRQQSVQRIKVHAKWKIGQDWTSAPHEMHLLLARLKAPVQLQSAVQKIQEAHPSAEFQLEVFDEDPILRVRRQEPGMDVEQYILGAWGLPEKFTFR